MSLIRTPFGFDSTAVEVIAGIDLSHKRAIVTGSSSGIGIETAGARLGGSRRAAGGVQHPPGAKTAADIIETTGNAAIHVAELDLANPRSVSAFVAEWHRPLDVLVNNAGVMAIPDLLSTPDGWELHFATNHLGHFALAVGLHDALDQGIRRLSAQDAGAGRGDERPRSDIASARGRRRPLLPGLQRSARRRSGNCGEHGSRRCRVRPRPGERRATLGTFA